MSAHVPLATRRSGTGIPTGRLAVWWIVGSEIVIFGGVLASYLLLRLMYDHWSEAAVHTNTLAGGLNTFVLLTSSLFIVLAHYYAEHKEHIKSFICIWLTIGGGMKIPLSVKPMPFSSLTLSSNGLTRLSGIAFVVLHEVNAR